MSEYIHSQALTHWTQAQATQRSSWLSHAEMDPCSSAAPCRGNTSPEHSLKWEGSFDLCSTCPQDIKVNNRFRDLFTFVSKQVFIIQSKLSWNLFCRPGRSLTQRRLPASASCMLGLEVWTTTSRLL